MNDRIYPKLTALVFLAVGLAHLARAALGWPISIDGFAVPVPLSWPLGLAALALGAWGLSLKSRG